MPPPQSAGRVGVVFGSLTAPEHLAAGSAHAERLGFGDVWFSEDCFFTGAMSGVTQLLASTEGIPVGLGLASTQTRHPAVLAMEIAGIARMYPGRTRFTLGLGNTQWLRQMGLEPRRPLSSVLADLHDVGALLRGETVDRSGGPGHVLREVRLDFPPAEPPPLWLGAVNERALRAAGAHADGVLLSVLAGPRYVRWASEQVHRGAAEAGRPAPPITAFVLASVDRRGATARAAVLDAVRFFARAEAGTALIAQSAATDAELAQRDVWSPSETRRLVAEHAAAGTAEQVAQQLGELLESGADSVALWVFPSDRLHEQLEVLAADVLPHLEGSR